MVTVKKAHQRQSKEGNVFIALELTGDLELVQSQQTGRFYATVRRCFISSTLSVEQATQFIGQKMQGSIVRVSSDPYDYTVPETGEVITLCHTYSYQPDELTEVRIAKSEPIEGDFIVDEVLSQIGD
jgi:hypothetical protein